jgi:hypothetical protein
MKRISFNPRFVKEAGDDLIPGKITTIRENYRYWEHTALILAVNATVANIAIFHVKIKMTEGWND